MRKYTAAVGQMNSGSDKERNLRTAEDMIREAAGKGASLIVLPENMNGMNVSEKTVAEELDSGETLRRMAAAARENRIFVNLGAIKEKVPGEEKVYNTSVLFGPDGERLAVYRKTHLCDMSVRPGHPGFRESDRILPGDRIVSVETELGHIGMTICYDLRFAELYRLLALRNVKVVTLPSCFGRKTGEAHWELLNRARAVENGFYMLAAGQCGMKENGSLRYGNSMIVDAFGTVIARADADTETVIYGEIDLDNADELIEGLGSIKNRRTDLYELREHGEGGNERA